MPLVVITVALLIQIFFIATSILPWAQVLWDEAEFLMWIQRVTLAIQSFSVPQITKLFWDQIHYPPFQSILYGLLLAPFGFSVTGARIVSLGLSVLSAYLTYSLGVKVSGSKWVGFVASLLFISSPILMYLQSIALKEALFIPLILLVCLSYITAKPIYTGIFLTLLFFTKYELAGIIAIALAIEALVAFVTEKKKLDVIVAHIFLFGIPLLFALPWIYGSPEHTRIFFLHINNSFDTTGGQNFITNALFYPRAVVYSYGLTFTIGMILLVSWIQSFTLLKQKTTRFLFMIFTTNVALLVPRIMNLQDRYLAISIPALFVMTAIHIVSIMQFIRSAKKPAQLIAIGIAMLLTGEVVIRIRHFDQWIYGIGTKAMLVNAFHQLDSNVSWFNYDPSTWAKIHPRESKESMHDITSFIMTHVNPHVPFVVRGRLAELSPPYIHMVIETEKARTSPTPSRYDLYHITLTVVPGSRYYNHEYKKMHEWVQWEVEETKNDPTFELVAQRLFAEFGINVGIYRKKPM